ncbi:hypothetical protein DSL64_04210 [Dyadobacter luteus]|jgi:hypothetical protein|uniref:DUF304 domain-containing protein n=1 Tax=Dyadobacter luteus TaxID=2259619 RepID=A0A3D8YIT1_9BACT|nr:hypothetical protein [Dyadobacter luteus]REA63650.1 hypothetical protein DSL64_04210 [Dyadobacter luteus]
MKFSQFGKTMLISLIVFAIIASAILSVLVPDIVWIKYAAAAAVLLVFLNLYKLDVTTTDEYVVISLGIGLIQRKIYLRDIQLARSVKNTWWVGLGIRYGLEHTLYSVFCLDAVELSLNANKGKVRINTDSAVELAKHINQELT